MKKIILLTSLVAISLQGMDQNAYHQIANGVQVPDVSGVQVEHRVPRMWEMTPSLGHIGDGKASVSHVSFVVGAVFIKDSQSPYMAIAKQNVGFINPSRIFNSSKKNPRLKGCDLRFMQNIPDTIHCLDQSGSPMSLSKLEFGLRFLSSLNEKNEGKVRAYLSWLKPEQATTIMGGVKPYLTSSGLETYNKITQSNDPLFLLGNKVKIEDLKKEVDRLAAEAFTIAKALSAEATKAAANMLGKAKIQIDEKIGGFYGITTGILISIAAYFAFLRNK